MYYNRKMTRVLFFTIYILFFALISSLLFTILYMQFDEQPILALNKAIKYGAMVMCAIFIVPAMKYRRLYSKEIVGYLEPKMLFIQNICKGFGFSVILLLPLIISFAVFDVRNISFNLIKIDNIFFYTLVMTIFVSFLISIIEESFFRGILIQTDTKKIKAIFVITFAAIVYSLFHFIKIPFIFEENIYWNTGLIELVNVFFNFFNTIHYDAALTLIMFGLLLGVVRFNLKTISYGIGIHTGFVFTIKIFKQSSVVNSESNFDFLLSTYDHFLGNLASIWVAIILFIYLFYIYKYR